MALIPTAITRRTTTFTTNLLAFQNVDSIASSNFVAGRKYLLLVQAQWDGANNAHQYGIRVQHGATTFPTSDTVYEPGTILSPYTFGWMTVHTAVAGEDIVLQINSQDGSDIRVHLDTLIAIELSEQFVEGTDFHFNENLTSEAIPAFPTFTSVSNASITFTPPNAGDTWLIITNALIQSQTGTEEYLMRLARSGEVSETGPVFQQESENPAIPDQFLVFAGKTLTLGNVSNTFFNEVTSIDTANGNRLNSAVFAINLSKFATFSSSFNPAGIVIDNSNLFANATEIATADMTPKSALTDTLILTGFVKNADGTTNGREPIKARQQFDNADAPATQTADDLSQLDGWDERDRMAWRLADIISTPGASLHSVDLDATDVVGDTLTDRLALQIELATPSIDFTFDVDAIIVNRNTITFTADGLIQQTQTFDFTVDAILKATQDNDFLVDALVQVATAIMFDVNALLQAQNQTLLFTVDSIIVNKNTTTFTLDALVRLRQTNTFTNNAIVVARNDLTFIVDGAIKSGLNFLNFFVDALVRGQEVTPDADISNAGGWVPQINPTLFQELDNLPRDPNQFIRFDGTRTPVPADSFEVSMGNMADPNRSDGHIVSIFARANTPGPVADDRVKFRIKVFQDGTILIATTPFFTLPSPTEFTSLRYELTASEADAITNYLTISFRGEPILAKRESLTFTGDAILV